MKKLPLVAIVGFPNVGKSTLFNRLLQRKKSLVHSLPGMTRDAVSAPCLLGEKAFLLVDTGGIFDFDKDPFSTLVKEKAWESSREADILVFVIDGKRELLPLERELYLDLVKLNKPMIVVINKVDSDHDETKIGDLFSLGPDRMISLSAEHKRNIFLLKDSLSKLLPETDIAGSMEDALKIALVGRINVGKSSLVNLLYGQPRLIVSDIPGTTRDSTDTLIFRNKKAFCLVDTAGIRKLSRTQDQREKAGIIKTKKNITRADVVCMIIDAQEFPTRQDTAIAHIAEESSKPLILALNKWDLVDKESGIFEDYRFHVKRKLDFISYAPVITISALTGQRVVKILDVAETVYANGGKKISTSGLNDFLSWIHEKHPPITRNKGKMKIKYMTQIKVLPPTFLLFTHSSQSLAPSYEKHFINLLREQFDFSGTPVRIYLRKN